MYPQQNDVIRRYTEQVILLILFLSTETDNRGTRKWKLLSFSDLQLFYANNKIRTPKFRKILHFMTSVWRYKTFDLAVNYFYKSMEEYL